MKLAGRPADDSHPFGYGRIEYFAGMIVAALVFSLSGVNVDCWLAAAISCLIIKAGLEMLMSPVNELLGTRNSSELTSAIKSRVKEETSVRGVYDVVIHNYGPEQNIGALHVEVEDTMTASELHHLTRQIQMLVKREFGIFVTV